MVDILNFEPFVTRVTDMDATVNRLLKFNLTQFYDFFVTFYDDVIDTGSGQIQIQWLKLGQKTLKLPLSVEFHFGLSILKSRSEN